MRLCARTGFYSGGKGRSPIIAWATLGTALLLLVAACSGGPKPEGPPAASLPGRLPVVATIGILADLARNVGGGVVEVRSLAPPGGDVETFRLTPRDGIAIKEARVIVSNGAGLDSWLDPALAAAKSTEAAHVVAAQGLEGRSQPGNGAGSRRDPHFWQDPRNAVRYVERIRDALVQADPPRAATYRANAAAYIAKLEALDKEIAAKLEAVPPQRRVLVTFHDAFGHFARRYGWRTAALASSGAEEVSPQSIVSVVEQIRAQGIGTVFAEPQVGQDVLRQLARDAGVKVGRVYSDSLDERVSTYIDMMRYNAQSLVEGLR